MGTVLYYERSQIIIPTITCQTPRFINPRRSRLLAHPSWQLANMLQNVSSLVSQSTYSVSLDSLLPWAKSKGFQMTPDLELNDDDNNNDIKDRENVPCGENNTIVFYIQEDKTGGLLPAPLPLPSLQPGLQLIQPVLQLLVPPGQLLNLLDRLSQ